MATDPPRATGHCLCGSVRYRVEGPLRGVYACHCEQCRRSHGHYAAYTAARTGDLVLEAQYELRWYRSSPQARRGFCARCGSSLFWVPDGQDLISIAAGTLDPPTGLKTVCHVYAASAGDYYAITGGLPRHAAAPR